ncbi:MAG: helix-turn-helix domain-containing protein, partial [Nocardioides sp.]
TEAGTTPVQLGRSIRALREERRLSLRELARRVNVSPSFVSQIELGKANPSVGTLYSLLSVLGTTLDDLIGEQPTQTGPTLLDVDGPGGDTPSSWPRVDEPVQSANGRKRVEMSGVAWERLTSHHDPYVDFLHVEYAPGSSSCAPDQLMRHGGREYGYLLNGRLDIQVGFETYSLGPGDSIHFDSMTPHRLSNPSREPCTAVWFVLERRDDERMTGLE